MSFQNHIDSFILYLATERGLSDNYQLATRGHLEKLISWLEQKKKVTDPKKVTLDHLTAYLAFRKGGARGSTEEGISAASVRQVGIAIKIFFRWHHGRRAI